MNNKSFYSIVALAAIMDLVLVLRPWDVGSLITRAILCGAALYYVVQRIKARQGLNALMVLMSALALLLNPVAPFQFPIWVWCIVDSVALLAFFYLSRSIKLIDEDDNLVQTKEWSGMMGSGNDSPSSPSEVNQKIGHFTDRDVK